VPIVFLSGSRNLSHCIRIWYDKRNTAVSSHKAFREEHIKPTVILNRFLMLLFRYSCFTAFLCFVKNVFLSITAVYVLLVRYKPRICTVFIFEIVYLETELVRNLQGRLCSIPIPIVRAQLQCFLSCRHNPKAKEKFMLWSQVILNLKTTTKRKSHIFRRSSIIFQFTNLNSLAIMSLLRYKFSRSSWYYWH
jgi:hypothetical protein